MGKVRSFVEQYKTFVALAGGAVVGLIVGLIVGWVLWPVEWTSSTPANLHSKYQSDYAMWVASNYQQQGGVAWAEEKLGAPYWKKGQLAELLENLAADQRGEAAAQLRALSVELGASEAEAPEAGAPEAGEPEAGAPETGEAEARKGASPLLMVCGVGLLVAAVVGAVLLLITRARTSTAVRPSAEMAVKDGELPSAEPDWGSAGPPQAQFVTTYVLGDDHYDPSFSIELETSEFMGECGVGISETLGVGDPNKVTAFEVWLFDKNDIRTVTKVLMSDYAFNDDALYAKLTPKGEPMLAQVAEGVELETKRLRLRARVLDAEYGEGNLPSNSFFQKLTVELTAWVKPAQEGTQPLTDSDITFA